MSSELVGDEAFSSLAQLVARMADGTDRLDEAFTRDMAARLHEHADRVSFAEVDALALEDIIVTFYMDRRMRLVVTGNLSSSQGQVSISWNEADFPRVPVTLHVTPRTAPYTFATLDFSVRGHRAELRAPAPPLPAGVEVGVRCLSTVGDVVTYRVRAHGVDASVAPADLNLLGD